MITQEMIDRHFKEASFKAARAKDPNLSCRFDPRNQSMNVSVNGKNFCCRMMYSARNYRGHPQALLVAIPEKDSRGKPLHLSETDLRILKRFEGEISGAFNNFVAGDLKAQPTIRFVRDSGASIVEKTPSRFKSRYPVFLNWKRDTAYTGVEDYLLVKSRIGEREGRGVNEEQVIAKLRKLGFSNVRKVNFGQRIPNGSTLFASNFPVDYHREWS